MTQKDRQLLLKDLCARLPYNVVCDRLGRAYQLVDIDIKRGLVYLLRDEAYVPYSISRGDIVKPYLRPLSSMTRKERSTYITLLAHGPASYIVAWLDANHFDHRVNKEGDSLIDLGLAIEVTKENNPYKDIKNGKL